LSYIEKYGFLCEKIRTFDHDRGLYNGMVEDFSKRLKLALKGKIEDLDKKLEEYFKFLKFIVDDRVFLKGSANGAEIIWVLRKN